jgi:hypothetical protein
VALCCFEALVFDSKKRHSEGKLLGDGLGAECAANDGGEGSGAWM